MNPLGWLGEAFNLIGKLIPDPVAKAQAQARLVELQQAGEFKAEELRYSAIVAEAGSSDKWTSRARPSFLYVVYCMILAAFPIGVLSVFNAAAATQIAVGATGWLHAMPEELWWLFGSVMLGYTAGRSWEKTKGVAK